MYKHHYTMQVAQVQVGYLSQWLEGKTPPAQVAVVIITICAVEYLCQLVDGKAARTQVVKLRGALLCWELLVDIQGCNRFVSVYRLSQGMQWHEGCS